jgi:5-methylcytosine-specific restriction enzyme A
MTTLRTLGRPKVSPSNRHKVRLVDNKRAFTSFYLSTEWRTLTNQIKRDRGAVCEDLTHSPRHPRSGVRLIADHRVELKDGGAPLDPRNIMLRCGACHTRKTMVERARRYHQHTR